MKMNRRAFSASFASLSLAATGLAHAQSEPEPTASATALNHVSTFSIVGKQEKPWVHQEEATLAEKDGAGYIDHMWFGGSFSHFQRLRLRIYVDGESSPAIDTELGLGVGVGFEDPAAPWGIKWCGISGSPSGIFLNYRIPFSRRVRVTATLPAGVSRDTVFWWIVRGLENHSMEVSGVRLPQTARLKLYSTENYLAKPLDEFNLCHIAGSGLIFQVTMAAKSENFQFLEGQMRAYMGDSTTPEYLSSGLEDYFLGTYYFNRGMYHFRQAGLTHKDDQDFSFSAYRFHDLDPIVFSNGIRLACRCGEERGGKSFGTTGDPRQTIYTTNVWAYVW